MLSSCFQGGLEHWKRQWRLFRWNSFALRTSPWHSSTQIIFMMVFFPAFRKWLTLNLRNHRFWICSRFAPIRHRRLDLSLPTILKKWKASGFENQLKGFNVLSFFWNHHFKKSSFWKAKIGRGVLYYLLPRPGFVLLICKNLKIKRWMFNYCAWTVRSGWRVSLRKVSI